MKKITLTLSILSSLAVVSACSTTAESGGSITESDNILASDALKTAMMAEVDVSKAIALGNVFLYSYGDKLEDSAKWRRRFNVASLLFGAYTGIGAGLDVHSDNLVVTTALGALMPQIEPQFQTNGSPETIGTAVTKTACVIRAAQPALKSEIIVRRSNLERYARLNSDRTDVNSALASYDSLAETIRSGYISVYINYSVNSVPPQISASSVTSAVSGGGNATPTTPDADEKSNSNLNIFLEGQSKNRYNFISLSKSASMTSAEAKENAAYLSGFIDGVSDSIATCVDGA